MAAHGVWARAVTWRVNGDPDQSEGTTSSRSSNARNRFRGQAGNSSAVPSGCRGTPRLHATLPTRPPAPPARRFRHVGAVPELPNAHPARLEGHRLRLLPADPAGALDRGGDRRARPPALRRVSCGRPTVAAATQRSRSRVRGPPRANEMPPTCHGAVVVLDTRSRSTSYRTRSLAGSRARAIHPDAQEGIAQPRHRLPQLREGVPVADDPR